MNMSKPFVGSGSCPRDAGSTTGGIGGEKISISGAGAPPHPLTLSGAGAPAKL